MLTGALDKIAQNRDLTRQEVVDLVDYISTGEANPDEIASLLTSLKDKGESTEEITGFAMAMRKKAVQINVEGIENIVDTCGTGGDGINSFNVSTASAIVAAACGLPVAKHSNAGITSKCGSSNVIEALGIPLLKEPGEVENSLRKNSIAFIHAPFFHKSTHHVSTVRKKLGIRTVFNYLGPLTNPTKPSGQVIGVSNPEMLPKIAQSLLNLGCRKAMVVCGIDPVMDEISICGRTLVYKLENGQINDFDITPEEFGLAVAPTADIAGGSPEINAGIIRDIFSGKIKGPKLDIVTMNSAAVLWAGNKVQNLQDGINTVSKTIESGQVLHKLEELKVNNIH